MKIAKVVFVLGSQAELARVCGVSRQRVSEWLVVPEPYHEKVRQEVKGRVAKLIKIAGEI
jgi:predicted transcriptional regulator